MRTRCTKASGILPVRASKLLHSGLVATPHSLLSILLFPSIDLLFLLQAISKWYDRLSHIYKLLENTCHSTYGWNVFQITDGRNNYQDNSNLPVGRWRVLDEILRFILFGNSFNRRRFPLFHRTSEFRYRRVFQKLFKIFASQEINDPIRVKVRLHDDNFSLDSVSTRALYTLCYTASEFYQSVSIATATRSFNLEARYNARATTSQTHLHHGCNIYIYIYIWRGKLTNRRLWGGW